jgi:diguanylate cyclase (GGDEF)-like protein
MIDRQRIHAWLTARSRLQIIALTALGLVIVGAADHFTGYEVSVAVFYLLPVALAAWYAGRNIGLGLCVASAITWLVVDRTSGHPYSNAAFIYWNAGVRLAFFVVVTQLLHRLRVALAAQESLAQRDALTGLLNGRSLRERYGQLAGLAARDLHPMAIAFVDLDGFKSVNDTLGHAVGDEVLRAVSAELVRRLRGTDVVGRMGGDEFAVLLPQTDRAGASTVMQAVHEGLDAAVAARGWPIGFSIGVGALAAPLPTEAVAFASADALMYRVKKSGGKAVLVETVPVDAAGHVGDAAQGDSLRRGPRNRVTAS